MHEVPEHDGVEEAPAFIRATDPVPVLFVFRQRVKLGTPSRPGLLDRVRGRRATGPRPSLVACPAGLTYVVSSRSAVFLAWSDITRFRAKVDFDGRVLGLCVMAKPGIEIAPPVVFHPERFGNEAAILIPTRALPSSDVLRLTPDLLAYCPAGRLGSTAASGDHAQICTTVHPDTIAVRRKVAGYTPRLPSPPGTPVYVPGEPHFPELDRTRQSG